MTNHLISVGIIFGGASGEHDISIKSAQAVINALKGGNNSQRFDVISIYIDKEGRWWSSDIAYRALTKGCELKEHELPLSYTSKGFQGFPEEVAQVDTWFPVLHGPNGEDGTVQGLLTLIGKPFVGSGVLGSALGMDKLAMKASFASAGLPQVPYEKVNAEEIRDSDSIKLLLQRLENKIGYPCFIKPANLGSSVGITKGYKREQLISGLKLASNFDKRIVVEKFIHARELECAVLGKKRKEVSVVGEIKHNSDWYDYHTKYSSNLSQALIPAPIPQRISDKIHQLSLAACEATSAHTIARVDFFYNEFKNEIFINEINTLPGFTKQSMYPMLWSASGLNMIELVAQLIEIAME